MPFPDPPPIIVTPPAPVPTEEERAKSPLSPKTTAEQDRVTAGQRRVNIVWEVTQSAIALIVTATTLYVAAQRSMFSPGETAAFLLLSNGFFLVIGFYFGRTNHQRVGGVGSQDSGR